MISTVPDNLLRGNKITDNKQFEVSTLLISGVKLFNMATKARKLKISVLPIWLVF